MNSLNLTRAVIACLLIASLFSCSSTPSGQQYSTPQKEHPLTNIAFLSDRDKADLYAAIIAADMAAAKGEHEVATSYYLAAARTSKSLDLILLTIESAKQSNDGLALMQAADLWLKQSPKESEALALKIAGLLNDRDINQAIDVSKLLFEQKTEPEERADLLTLITEDLSLPITNAYLTQLNAVYPKSTAVLFSKAQFLIGAAKQTKDPTGITRQAFSFLNSALAVEDNFIPAVELKTRLLYQMRQDEKAEAMLRKLHSKYPKSADINQLLGQLLYDLRKYDLTKLHYNEWLKKHPADHEARFFLAAAYFATSDFITALNNYRHLLGSDYKPQLSYFFCGNSASQIKNYKQAIHCYQQVSSGKYLTRSKIELAKLHALLGNTQKALEVVRNPNFASSEAEQIQLINIEVEILDQHLSKERAIKRLATAMKTYPTALSLLFKKIKIEALTKQSKTLIPLLENARSNLTSEQSKQQYNLTISAFLRNNSLYQEAVDWLTNALVREPDNTDYIYARTLYKEPLGLVDEMITEFKQLLKLDPTNLNVKNALGYTLVDVNQELEYAGQLIDQAYAAMPNNAAVIDSKGWLAYRNGSLDQAIKYLSLSFRLAPSADVAVHIGEVYWQKGEKGKAKDFWSRAKAMDEKNYLLSTTMKKFGVSLSN